MSFNLSIYSSECSIDFPENSDFLQINAENTSNVNYSPNDFIWIYNGETQINSVLQDATLHSGAVCENSCDSHQNDASLSDSYQNDASVSEIYEESSCEDFCPVKACNTFILSTEQIVGFSDLNLQKLIKKKEFILKNSPKSEIFNNFNRPVYPNLKIIIGLLDYMIIKKKSQKQICKDFKLNTTELNNYLHFFPKKLKSWKKFEKKITDKIQIKS